MDDVQRIDVDEIRATQIALVNVGRSWALLMKDAEFWKIKYEGVVQAQDQLLSTLREKGIDLEELLIEEVSESSESDQDALQDDEEDDKVSVPPKAPKES